MLLTLDGATAFLRPPQKVPLPKWRLEKIIDEVIILSWETVSQKRR